uniref:Peritrophic membrane chitin binding protein P42 n=1 Tax=Holotrichia parallela TaxID=93412 RepID=A0A088BU37_HOLPA|nr:peritrophic membrane chitin binding protein P42 [Holotrichia parallela]
MNTLLTVAISSVLLALVAGQCVQETNCMLANGCVCASRDPPIEGIIPQFVTVTFHDAVSSEYMDSIYYPLLANLRNPNGDPASATFYVPHEYTDYSLVNELYNLGFEIGVHSITRDYSSEYWTNADVNTLVDEFYGQKQIISRFANIPIADVVGARVPNFQNAGNNLYLAYQQSGIEYDNTWTARSTDRFFPFSLDQVNENVPCIIGECPDTQFPGIWAAPVIDLESNGIECNNLLACIIEDDAQKISDWLYAQFMESYLKNRAPITLAASAAWFLTYENAFAGFSNFLSRISNLNTVYLVSHKQVIDYMKNPVPVNEYVPTEVGGEEEATCSRRSCPLRFNDEIRYMVVCTASCPASYPWLGNPNGI